MQFKSDTITGVAHWASYLINDDSSGMEESEIALCDKWCKSILPWRVVSTTDSEPYFTWSGQLYGADCSGVTVCEYVVHAQTLPVIFRKESDGQPVAIFPTLCEGYAGWHMRCYAHIGQHGSATLDYYRDTKPARPDDYAALLGELRGIYADVQLVVYQRMTPAHKAAWRADASRMANA